MSSELSPVLRLIPYLLAITVAVFAGIPAFGAGEALFAVLVIVLTLLASALVPAFVRYRVPRG